MTVHVTFRRQTDGRRARVAVVTRPALFPFPGGSQLVELRPLTVHPWADAQSVAAALGCGGIELDPRGPYRDRGVCVAVRRGTSGCLDISIRQLADYEAADAVVVAAAHITSAGLVERFMALNGPGLAALLVAIDDYYPQSRPRGLRVVPAPDPQAFIPVDAQRAQRLLGLGQPDTADDLGAAAA